MRSKTTVFWFFSGVAVLLLIVGSILLFHNGKKEDKTVVGVILPGSSDELGWNGTHYQGIKAACEELGVGIEVYENAAEYSGECEKAIRKMAEKGIRMIFLESFNYPDEVGEIIKEYPEISFYCCSTDISLKNYKTYFARVYQARYLSGIVAGMKTESNHIGYVAAMDNSEVNRGINAFTLGVQSVNPEATVHVTYTGAWDNKEKEQQKAYTLVKECGVDVLSYHQNQSYIVDVAEEMGVYVIGYNIEQGEYSDYLLTSVVSRWDIVYQEIIRDYLQNKNVGDKNYWIGIEKEAVGLAFYSGAVPQDAIEEVDRAIELLGNNKEVFSGRIYDREGNQRCSEDEVIRDEVLMQKMDWLVEGGEVYEVN